MSTTLDHIVRHEFYDLRNMEAAEEFMKSKIAQLRSYLRIKDEINFGFHEFLSSLHISKVIEFMSYYMV